MASDVFSGVLFYVIQCNSADLIEKLKLRRAVNHPILSDRVKFAISDDNKLDQVGEAEDLYAVPVVTSEWVRLALEANSFLPFPPFHPNFRKIFTNVTVVFSELSLKDCITLSAHITIRGGVVKTALDSSVTHLICGRASGNLYDFCKNCMQQEKVKIISPDWVIESVKADKCINCENYNVDLLVKPSPPKAIKPKPVPAQPSTPGSQMNDPQAPSRLMAAQQQQQMARSTPEVNTSFAGSLQTPAGSGVSASQIGTNLDVVGGQMARMVPQPAGVCPTASCAPTHTVAERPTGSKGGKSKSNRHARDQELNEEQKDAIVMQNVMNILGQQHNWNRDNLQSRTGGIITGGSSAANTFSSTGSELSFACSISNTAGGHTLPGSFLPSGTSPLPAISSGARKSKSPKSPCRAGVAVASAGGTHKASTRGSSSFKASRTTSTAAARLAPTVGELHQSQRQQLHLPLTPTTLPLASIPVDALPTGATATVGGQSQQFAVVGGTAQLFHTHPQQHAVFVASGAVHPGLNRGATQNARMAMAPSIAAAGVVAGQQQSAQQTQQQQPTHQQSTQQAYLLQHQYPQTAMQEQYQQVQQQQQAVVTAQGQLKKAQRRPVGQTQMAPTGVLLSQQQQQAQYQARPTTLIVRAPPAGVQAGIRPMEQVTGDALKIATIDATSQATSTTATGPGGNRNLVAQQQQQQQQQQLIQGGVNTTHSAGTPTRISQQLLQENLQSAAVATPSSSSPAVGTATAYTQLGHLQHPQRVLLQPSGQLIQVQSASTPTPVSTALQLQAQRQAARGVPSSVSPAANLVPSVYLQSRQAIHPPSTAALQYKQQQQLQQLSPTQQLQVTAQTAGTQPAAQIVGQLQQQQAQRPQTSSASLQRSNMLRQAQPQQQIHYTSQLSQQQLKPAAQHQLVPGQLTAGSQQIIIQTSNGTQMVAQAQDLGNAQFVETASSKYIGGQLRAVGTSPAVQCASPRPPTYSLSQTGTVNGSTTSIVYHSTTSVESPSPQQGRATYLTMQGKTEGLMPLIKPETAVCRQQSGIGIEDNLAAGQQLQGQMLQTPHHPQQPQQQQQQQQQHIIVQTQQSPLQPHTVLQQGKPVHIHPQQQQQTATAAVVTQNQHLQIQQGHPLRPTGIPQQKVMGATLPLQATGPGYSQLVSAQHIALADPVQRQQTQLVTTGGQGQLDHVILAQQQQQQQHLQRAQRMPLQNQSWQQVVPQGLQMQQACRGAAVTPHRQSVVPPRTSTTSAVPGGQPRSQNAPQTAAVSLFQFPSYVGHVGDFSPSNTEDCLVGCVFLLLGYHSFGETQKALWRRIMRSYGAEIVLTYEPSRVTHVIVDWQLEEPELFKQALRDKKRVVTIYWVNDVLAKGKMIPPYEILHLPSPFCHEVTFSFIRSQVISVTGFEGIERQKIELIIKQLGASFTDYLDQSNTLLVFKRPQGKKYEMASLWGIPCVNVRWLQDLYLGDLLAISADIPHKYLSCEQSDVSLDLDLRTLRVMELMAGWQIGITLNKASWSRASELRTQLQAEQEVERLKQLLESTDEKENKCVLAELTPEELVLAESCKLRKTVLQEESLRVEAHRVAVAARQQAAAAAAAAAEAAAATAAVGAANIPFSTTYVPLQSAPAPLMSYLQQQSHLDEAVTVSAATAPAQPTETAMASLLLSTPPVSLPATDFNDLPVVAVSADSHSKATEQIAAATSEPTPTTCMSATVADTHSICAESQVMAAKTILADEQQEAINPSHPSRKRPHGPDDSASTVTKQMHLDPRSVPPVPASSPPPIRRPASVPSVVTGSNEELATPTVDIKPESNPSPPFQVSPQMTPAPSPPPPPACAPTATTGSSAYPVSVSEPSKPALNLEVRITFTALNWESRLAVTELLRKMAASADSSVAPYTIVNTVAEATHLIADRLVRTPKIYQAVAYGRPIVTPKWVQACLHRGDWVDEWQWLLVDPEAEENLGINLADSLRRSHERAIFNEPGLFEDMEVWFSPQARHRQVCEELVRICGGRDRDRRPTQKMALLPMPRQLIVCNEDEAHVATYLMRTKTGNRAVQHEEFVLSGVLRQELDFESYQIQYVSSLYAELQTALSTATKSLASSAPPPVLRNSSLMTSSLTAPDSGCHKMRSFSTHTSPPGVTATSTATHKMQALNGSASPLKAVNRHAYATATVSAASHWNQPELPYPRPVNIHPGGLSEHSHLLFAYSQSSCSSTPDTPGTAVATDRSLSLGVPLAVKPPIQGSSSSVGRLFSTKPSPPLATLASTSIVESSDSQSLILVDSIPPTSSHFTSQEPVSSHGNIPLAKRDFALSVSSPALHRVAVSVPSLSASATAAASDAAVSNCILLVAEQQQQHRSPSALPQQATSVMLLPTASSACLISGTFDHPVSGLSLPTATPTLLVSVPSAPPEVFATSRESSALTLSQSSTTSTAYLVQQCTAGLETSLASALQLPGGVSAVFVTSPPTQTPGLASAVPPLNARVAAADAHAVASATAAALSAITNQTATATSSESLTVSQQQLQSSPLRTVNQGRLTAKPDPGTTSLSSFATTSAPHTMPSPTSSSPSLTTQTAVVANSEAYTEETLQQSQPTPPPSKVSKPGNLIIDSSSIRPPTVSDDGRQVVEASAHETTVATSEALTMIPVSSGGDSNTATGPPIVETAPLSASTLEMIAPAENQLTGATDPDPAVEMMETTPPVRTSP